MNSSRNMRGKPDHIDDEVLARSLDRGLMRRLLGHGKPFAGLIALSLAMILVLTLLDLSIPMLTKTAIDRHIQREYVVLDWSGEGLGGLREETTAAMAGEAPEPAGPLKDLARLAALKSVDPALFRRIAAAGVVSAVTYVRFSPAERDGADRAVLEALASSPPPGSIRAGQATAVPSEQVDSLDEAGKSAVRAPGREGLLLITAVIVAVLALRFLFDYGRTIAMQYVGQGIMFDLRTRVFGHLQKMSLSFFDRHPVGKLVTRATNDVEVLNDMFANVLVNILNDVILLLGIVVVLVVEDWRLALVALSMLPFVVAASVFFRVLARRAYRMVRAKIAKINAWLQESISGIQVTKLFLREAENERRFSGLNEEHYQARLNELLVFSVFGPLIEVMSSIAIALVVWYGGVMTLSNTLTLGALVAFIAYVQMFFHPIRDISEKYSTLQAAMASSERIFQIIDEPEEIMDPPSPRRIGSPRGRIEFDHVWFAYEGENWVLKDVSFVVEPGGNLALVGATGAGKTSVISLLGRFYDVKRGRILIDGVDIRDMDQSYLRSLLGIVMQDVFIFSGDFMQNIRLKSRSITDEEVCAAAERVMASTFIERYPRKYVEEVQERGSTLSSGERQLLAFARAVAFDPLVLVLDEATANIDTETEEKIQKAISRMMEGRSTIVIAHRLSTIRNMERIAVLHRGEIAEMGSHDELVRRDGIYRKLVEIQAVDPGEPSAAAAAGREC